MKKQNKTMNLTNKQLELILEWFNSVQDMTASDDYLEKADYSLAYLILTHLGRKVPMSILKQRKIDEFKAEALKDGIKRKMEVISHFMETMRK